MLLLLAGLVMATAGLFAVRALTAGSSRRRRSLERVAEYDTSAAGPPRARLRRVRRARGGVVTRMLARVALKLTPRVDLNGVGLRLARAGLAERFSVDSYLAGKLVLGICGLLLGAVLGGANGSAGRGFVFALVFGLLGFFVPETVVTRRLRERVESIEAEMPTMLDVLAVSVEAGLGLDAALAMVVQHSHGRLADELSLTLNEVQMGASRADSLRRLAERVDVPEMGTFVNAIIQGERLGTPLTRMLRSLAGDMRVRRQLTAEERANKMPVKMMFPIGLCILPALLLIAVGPAVISVLQTLK